MTSEKNLAENISQQLAKDLIDGNIEMSEIEKAYYFYRENTQRRVQEGVNPAMIPLRFNQMCKHSGFTEYHQSLERMQDISSLLFARKKNQIRDLLSDLQKGHVSNSCKLVSILVSYRLSQLGIETIVRSIPNYHTDLYFLSGEDIDPYSFLHDNGY